MNCYEHPETTSVASCPDCAVGLCQTCTGRYLRPICGRCNAARATEDERTLSRNIRSAVVVGLIGAVFITAATLSSCKGLDCATKLVPSALAAFFVSAAIPYGWRGLSAFTPRVFVFVPILGLLLYYYFKLLLSIPVGMVLFPRELLRWRRQANEIKDKRAHINSHSR
jgi:hypothetical protein